MLELIKNKLTVKSGDSWTLQLVQMLMLEILVRDRRIAYYEREDRRKAQMIDSLRDELKERGR